MNAETFIENFGHVADSPDGVLKLRELLLQLAVRGRLVGSDPSDEPILDTIERIRATRANGNAKEKRRSGGRDATSAVIPGFAALPWACRAFIRHLDGSGLRSAMLRSLNLGTLRLDVTQNTGEAATSHGSEYATRGYITVGQS